MLMQMDSSRIFLLLVDDDEFFAKVIANQLREEYGHEVVVADNGREARKQVELADRNFDMILTDYDMPEMNGLELLRWLHFAGNETPVVMLTAAGSEVVAVEAMKLGAYDYIRKEQLDLQHLGVMINATHERHQFRISRQMEEARSREILLNAAATDRVRDVLNAISPTLNAALANIHSEIDIHGKEIMECLTGSERESASVFLGRVKCDTATLERAIRSLLELYRMLYAHHNESEEIESLGNKFEDLKKQR